MVKMGGKGDEKESPNLTQKVGGAMTGNWIE